MHSDSEARPDAAACREPGPRRPLVRLTGRIWVLLLVAVIAVGGLWTATHGVAGVAWAEVAVVLRGLTAWQLLRLSLVWLSALARHQQTYALAADPAVPHLRRLTEVAGP